ncbi:MAG: hypothetical protein LBD45_05630 [Bacteroidales bacterium]|jgi:enamine deaminase RidA (YjgF/YER057c/UK114 family)|nr:hypothetical protein [Bacteroidales bacterium]
MDYTQLFWPDLSASVYVSVFSSGNNTENSASESHTVIELNDKCADAKTQFENIEKAISRLKKTIALQHPVLICKRYFLSDAINQEIFIDRENNDAAISIVQQPPLNGTKVSLWAYWVDNCSVKRNALNAVIMERPAYTHLFNMQMHSHAVDEYCQTVEIFENYEFLLNANRCSLKDNAIRTWIYVQGVDTHYADMVKARRIFFEQRGLTPETHYIASTGIEGKYMHPETTVLMDAYSIANLSPEQITYLKGATHLNPTHEYGVTFERATAVDYGDRRHIFVSGTASIDNQGQIVHPLQIDRQIDRTFENITILLAEAGAEMDDVAQMIVYLRDVADYELTLDYMRKHYPCIPGVIVWAPVCRTGWLVEIECIAIKKIENNAFTNF